MVIIGGLSFSRFLHCILYVLRLLSILCNKITSRGQCIIYVTQYRFLIYGSCLLICGWWINKSILFYSIDPPSPSLPPAFVAGGRTDSPGGEGDGGSIFWKRREIGLPSYSKICTLCAHTVADEWLGIDFLFKVLKSSFSQSNRWT